MLLELKRQEVQHCSQRRMTVMRRVLSRERRNYRGQDSVLMIMKIAVIRMRTVGGKEKKKGEKLATTPTRWISVGGHLPNRASQIQRYRSMFRLCPLWYSVCVCLETVEARLHASLRCCYVARSRNQDRNSDCPPSVTVRHCFSLIPKPSSNASGP